MKRLSAGVIGAGAFATYHARQYANREAVELVGVWDPNADAAKVVADSLGVNAFDSQEALLTAVDIVTVASPAIYHAGGALAALKAGRHVYVEKPLAIERADAEAILAEAKARDLVVAVGHQERAVFQAMGLTNVPEQPTRLEAVRFGTPSTRNLDVSATLDLMVHDIDLALALIGSEVSHVAATGDDDAAQAEVTFANGSVATFAVSRIAPERKRTMKLVYPSGEVEIDFLTRAFRNTTPFALDAEFTETPAGKDPLGASIGAFIEAAAGRSPRPLVTGDEAQAALDLALRVDAARG
jgi:predicted dehydrogenase